MHDQDSPENSTAENQNSPAPRPHRGLHSLFIAIILLLAILIAWHFVLPLFGISLILSASAISVLIWFVPLLVIGALLFFFIPLVGAILLALLISVGVIVVIVLFPVLLPIILPIWILCAVISYLFRR